MRRYLITAEQCGPCVVLHNQESEALDQNEVQELELTDEDSRREAQDILEELDTEIGGIPAIVEVTEDEEDEYVTVYEGLNNVQSYLHQDDSDDENDDSVRIGKIKDKIRKLGSEVE